MDPKYLINSIKAGIFLLLLTPFIKNMNFYFPFVGPKGIYFMALAEMVFFIWVALAWRWKEYRPDLKNPLIAAALLFWAVSFAAAIFGADFSASFWSKFERMGGILMLSHLTAFMIVISSVFEKRDWRRLFGAGVGVALVIGVQAIFDLRETSRGGGFIGNDSFWAAYLLFNIFIALYLFLSQKFDENKNLKIFFGAAFLIMVFCLFFENTRSWNSLVNGNFQYPRDGLIRDVIDSGARGVKLAFLAGMAFLGILWMSTRKKIALKAAGLLVLLGAGIAGTAIVVFSFNQGSAIHSAVASKFGEGAIRARIVVWDIAWKGFLERPYLGWGPENFNLVFARYYNPCLGTPECSSAIWYDRAHNIIFDTLNETGVIGLASYLLVFAAALYILWKGYLAGKIDFVQAGVFTALLGAYFLQNLTVFDMVASYLMWFMCLGFIAWLHRFGSQEKKVWPQSFEWWQVLAPAGAGIICFNFFVLGPAMAGYDAVQAASSILGSPQRMQLYREALGSSPLGRYQIRLFFASQWIQAMETEGIPGKLTQKQIEETFVFIAGELENSVRESPLDFQSYLQLGRVYNSWSKFDKSKLTLAWDALEKAQKLSPKNQQSYWDLARTKLYQSQPDEAAVLARQAYDLYPNNAQSKTILEQINAIQSRAAGSNE